MFIEWFCLAVATIVVMILNVILSPILPFFINDEGYLQSWLSWFQTQDAPAVGDQSFIDREMSYTKDYAPWRKKWVCGFNWALRNPAYGFMQLHGITVMVISEYTSTGQEVDIGDNGYTLGSVYRTCKNNNVKYFDYKKVGKWSDRYGYMVQFGWSLNNIDKEAVGAKRRIIVDIRPRVSLKLGGETTK